MPDNRRMKRLGNIGLAALAVATLGSVGFVLAQDRSEPPAVSPQVQKYYDENVVNATAGPAQATKAADPFALPAAAGALLWSDTFDRADGEPGAAETGGEYLTHRTNQQLPLIVNGALSSVSQAPNSTGSGYVALRLPAEPYHVVQKFTISGNGSGQDSAVSIVPGHGATIPEIIDRDIHAIHTRNSVAVQVRDKASNDYATVASWPVSLKTDGKTVYTWSITRTAPDTIRVVDATGKEHVTKDKRYATLWGPDVYIQAVDQSGAPTPGDVTTVTEMKAYAAK